MEWIILVYLFLFEEFNQWTNWNLVQFPKRKFTDKKNGPKVEDIFRPYPSFGFVRPSHISFFRPTIRPSVRHMIRPSNKASVRPTNRWSIGQIVRPSHRSFVRCACNKKMSLGRSVLFSVCFVWLSRSWRLRLLPWITRSEVRGETSNIPLYFFRISSGRGGESI
jgi:hypothetical protein